VPSRRVLCRPVQNSRPGRAGRDITGVQDELHAQYTSAALPHTATGRRSSCGRSR